MTVMTRGLLLALLLALLPAAAEAKGRVVRCAITTLPGNAVQFKGPCRFLQEGGGSFSLVDKAGGDRGLISRAPACAMISGRRKPSPMSPALRPWLEARRKGGRGRRRSA